MESLVKRWGGIAEERHRRLELVKKKKRANVTWEGPLDLIFENLCFL